MLHNIGFSDPRNMDALRFDLWPLFQSRFQSQLYHSVGLIFDSFILVTKNLVSPTQKYEKANKTDLLKFLRIPPKQWRPLNPGKQLHLQPPSGVTSHVPLSHGNPRQPIFMSVRGREPQFHSQNAVHSYEKCTIEILVEVIFPRHRRFVGVSGAF